jgi:hypothetical protein
MSRKSWFGTTDGEDKSENENKAQYDFDRNNAKQARTVYLNRNGRNMREELRIHIRFENIRKSSNFLQAYYLKSYYCEFVE